LENYLIRENNLSRISRQQTTNFRCNGVQLVGFKRYNKLQYLRRKIAAGKHGKLKIKLTARLKTNYFDQTTLRLSVKQFTEAKIMRMY
jgi:hypothetical protein